jgi:glutamate synthase (NADH)
MSLKCPIGPEANILEASAQQVHRIWLNNPILSIADTNILKRSKHRGWKTKVIDLSFPHLEGTDGYETALRRISIEAEKAAQVKITQYINFGLASILISQFP